MNRLLHWLSVGGKVRRRGVDYFWSP